MIVLIDTNVILDVLLKREPYVSEAKFIMTKCADREITGYLAAHSIPNLFYILRKAYLFTGRMCSRGNGRLYHNKKYR